MEKKHVEAAMLDRILYIGEDLPENVAKDERPKFVLLGTPQEFLDSLPA